MTPIKDITGMTIGRLFVLGHAGVNQRDLYMWRCQCQCGNKTIVRGRDLQRRSGGTQSCGCLLKEQNKARAKHGKKNTATYRSWQAMRDRCLRTAHHAYPRYGGRGIKVCDRWDDFRNFLEDMGERPEGTEIDRKDNNGDYTSDNCRWATRVEQANNKSNSHLIAYDGRNLTLAQAARVYGIGYATLQKRIAAGWLVAKALTQPVQDHRRDEETEPQARRLYQGGLLK